jgi:hypothetical protein
MYDNNKVVAFEDWMVSREQPEGVSAVIMGREWTSPRTGAGSTGSTGAVSSQLIQDHPELLVTEVDLEEDRDREDYISVMKAQKAKDEAINADSVIGSAATTSNTTSSSATTSNTTSVASKDKASATARENDWTATSTSTSTSADSRSLSAAAEHQSTDRMINSSNAQQHSKTSPSTLQRQIGEERGERGREGGEESDASKLKITLTLHPKTENTSLQSSEIRERTFPGNVLLSSGASHNDDQNDILQSQVKEETKDEGEMVMEIVDDSSIPVSSLSLSSTPLTTSQSQSQPQSQYTESESAASAVLEVEVKDEVKDGVTDEAEALRKAFEDASDSDDDDDEEEEDDDGGGGDVGKGSAGGDVVMTRGNSDDVEEEEEEEEEDGEEVEEVLEVGGGAVVMEGQGEGEGEEVQESEEKKMIDMNTSAPVEETEAGTGAGAGVGDAEEEANEDDDDDEEDWMKDV